MQNPRKFLKVYSIFILILSVFTLTSIVVELWFGELNEAQIPEGSPENVLLIARIIILSISALLLLPQFYVGIKGLKIAKNPTPARAHIFWGIIIFVFTILGVIEPISILVKQGFSYRNLSSVFNIAIEAFIFFDYVRYARAVADSV